MVQAYWQICRLIIEDEQQGKQRAEYGKKVLVELADKLTTEFGKGFDSRELHHMRQFYLMFQKWDAVRPELSGTTLSSALAPPPVLRRCIRFFLYLTTMDRI